MGAKRKLRRLSRRPELQPSAFTRVTTLYPKHPSDFKRWLARNASRAQEVWVVLYKSASGRQTVSFEDALIEALCYGWSDHRAKHVDKERFAVLFAPCLPSRRWSARELGLAEALFGLGRMTEAGIAVLTARLRRGAAPAKSQAAPRRPRIAR